MDFKEFRKQAKDSVKKDPKPYRYKRRRRRRNVEDPGDQNNTNSNDFRVWGASGYGDGYALAEPNPDSNKDLQLERVLRQLDRELNEDRNTTTYKVLKTCSRCGSSNCRCLTPSEMAAFMRE